MTANDERLVYSVPDAAQLLSISRASLYVLIRTGKLRPSKILNRTVLTREEINRFIASISGAAA